MTDITCKRLLAIVGTRPEAIKMAPVILALRKEPWCRLEVCATAQHRQMLDQVLSLFGIVPDHDLDLMRPDQTLSDLTAKAVTSIDQVLREVRPDIVIAQGDTTTVLAAAVACFYDQVTFCHVEAGLRTYDLQHPFPEEFNRVVVSLVTRLHFAPTESARANLLREGVESERIRVTGNTVIDALLWMAERNPPLPIELDPAQRLLLVTVHRRENFGEPIEQICAAIRRLAEGNRDLAIILPVHPNPNVSQVVKRTLSNHPRIHLTHPLDYEPFVALMKRAHLILTDSGGVQEEAPALGKPVLVMRTTTERPEAITEGVALLVGTDANTIVAEAQRLLDDPEHYARIAKGVSPYGDGHAAARIVRALMELED